MNILHVISDTLSISGPANSLLTLLDNFSPEEYRAYVAFREPGSLSEEIEKRGITCLFLSLPKPSGRAAVYFALRLPVAVLQLVWFIRQHRVHLVHVHQAWSMWGMVAGKLAGVPVVFHAREHWGNRFYKQLFFYCSTRIIAISHAVEKFLSKDADLMSRKKISVVYNAVDLDRFNQAKSDSRLRHEMSISEDVPFVLMVSKLIENKGHLDFINSCIQVKKHFPDAVFMIVGGELPGHEKYAEKVKQAAGKSELQGSLYLAGFRNDVERFLAAADVVVQPSTCDEGLGRVPIEAMALAKPVVATISGGMIEVVVDSETGYLVPKHDPDALAQCIIKLLDNSELRREFGQAGYQRAHELFGVPEHVQKIREIYNDIV